MSHVTKEISEGIGTVEFFTLQSNSLPSEILNQLARTITELGQNPEVSVIVLKSGGDRAFCAGANFDELLSISNHEEGTRFFMGFANVINAIRKVPKLVIGRVQGKTVGGGVGLIACMDYAFATTEASVKLSELSIGIGPFVISPALERKIGVAGLSHLAVNAWEFHSSKWAKAVGLYAEVFKDNDSMDEAVNNLAVKLSQTNPEAMERLKKTLWRGTDHWDTLLAENAQISGNLVLSDHTKSYLSKFRK